jgi:pimeloyl-ACP methyl ester carboxylesterase/DNA-binding winged helix-turn-helix (wHTH) protein
VSFSFAGYVFDPARRELRRGGEVVPVQPQVFDLLAYLIEQRARVVTKEELLDALWPDAEVTEGSLQRTVSLARAALEHGGEIIRTYPRRGYRFVADVQPAAAAAAAEAEVPPPRYVRRADVHLAWRAIGAGEVDLVMIPGWSYPMSAWFGLAQARAALAGLTTIGRVILFDKRGVGLSDRVKEVPSLEERMEDLRAVLDAAGSARAIVLGISEGAPMALLYAATYPRRVRGLVLAGAFARMSATEGYPWGWSAERISGLRAYIGSRWGAGATMCAMVPRHAGDAEVQRWAATAEQQGASPGAALDLIEMNLAIDARPIVPNVHVPSVVLHQRGDTVMDVGAGRHLAQHLPDCRHVEIDGDDHAFLIDGGGVLLAEVRGLVERTAPRLPADDAAPHHVLTTALVGEVAGGDPGEVLRRFGAEAIVHEGARVSACFAGPARAIRCAQALVAALGGRFGVHISEVVRDGPRWQGPALVVAARLAGAAPPGAILVSRVVPDLVAGALLSFAPAGEVDGAPALRVA